MARLKQDIGGTELPRIWILSDARNDAVLEAALKRLPRGSGLVLRHYHLPEAQRRARFAALLRIARARGHRVVLAGTMAQARAWGAHGAYGPARLLAPGGGRAAAGDGPSLGEMTRAARADALVLSPVFPTRSHPGGKVLGPLRFRLAGGACAAAGDRAGRHGRAPRGAAWRRRLGGDRRLFAVSQILGFS